MKQNSSHRLYSGTNVLLPKPAKHNLQAMQFATTRHLTFANYSLQHLDFRQQRKTPKSYLSSVDPIRQHPLTCHAAARNKLLDQCQNTRLRMITGVSRFAGTIALYVPSSSSRRNSVARSLTRSHFNSEFYPSGPPFYPREGNTISSCSSIYKAISTNAAGGRSDPANSPSSGN